MKCLGNFTFSDRINITCKYDEVDKMYMVSKHMLLEGEELCSENLDPIMYFTADPAEANKVFIEWVSKFTDSLYNTKNNCTEAKRSWVKYLTNEFQKIENSMILLSTEIPIELTDNKAHDHFMTACMEMGKAIKELPNI